MKINSNKKTFLLISFFLATLLYVYSPKQVNALEVNFDGVGATATFTGGGGKITYSDKLSLGGCWALKVNLVKLTSSGPDWASFYYVFDDVHGTNYQIFNSEMNLIRSSSGKGAVIGQIFSSGYDTKDAFVADNRTLSGDFDGESNFFSNVGGSLSGLNFNTHKLEGKVVSIGDGGKEGATDLFYKILFYLLKSPTQRNSVNLPCQSLMSGISDWGSLKDNMKNETNDWSELKDYRIIFEPIYRFNNLKAAGTNDYIFTTMKAGAQYLNDEDFYGVDQQAYASNCLTENTHGSIIAGKDSDASFTGMINVNSGRGYTIMTIVNGGSTCDPTKECCYDASGNYKADPNPPANASTYRCDGTVNADKSCAGSVVSCASGGPGDGTCKPDEYGPFYNYYMFMADKARVNFDSENPPKMETEANASNFNDYEIFKQLLDEKEIPVEDGYSLANIRVLEEASGKIDIHRDNIRSFYETLKKVRANSNFYIRDGDSFYITHNEYRLKGETEFKANVPITGDIYDFERRSIYAQSYDITRSVNNNDDKNRNKGFTFNVSRTFVKGSANQNFISDSPNLSAEKFSHPAEYRVAYCLTTKKEDDCKDDVTPAVCYPSDTGTHAVFHENNNLKVCTNKPGNNSGFRIIDQNDIGETDSNDFTRKGYCSVSCKEDLDLYLPGTKHTAAGQYFLLDNYVPKITAKRTCVTTEIKYTEFKNDLNEFEKTDNLPKKYNEFQDYYNIYTHFKTEDSLGNVSSGTDECSYSCGTEENPETCYASYSYEDWELYPYDSAPNRAQTGIKFDGDSGRWESSTVCSGGGEKYRTAVKRWTNKYFKDTRSAKTTYYNTLWEYVETINDYNTCFSWTDQVKDTYLEEPDFSESGIGIPPEIQISEPGVSQNKYSYRFKPTVRFDYTNNDSGVFKKKPYAWETKDYDKLGRGGCGKDSRTGEIVEGCIESEGFKNTYTYWPEGASVDDAYSNGSDKIGPENNSVWYKDNQNTTHPKGKNDQTYQLLNCQNQTCTSVGSKTGKETYFYSSAYVKKEEEVEYSYKLPRIYTTIPDGRVENRYTNPTNKEHLNLDEQAVPVNINTPEGSYPYKIEIEGIEDDLRQGKAKKNANDSKENSNNLEMRFNDGTKDTPKVLNLSNGTYTCNYDVVEDIYIVDERFNFFYRIIDPYDINPVGRVLGYNWTRTDSRANAVQDRMTEGEEDYQVLTNSPDRDKFVFTLTPAIMKSVRKYNLERSINDNGYADWDLNCNDYSQGGYHCYSNFLSCLVQNPHNESGGMDCSRIFGNTVTTAPSLFFSDKSNYDYSALNDNRDILIRKQNDLDEDYDGRVSDNS